MALSSSRSIETAGSVERSAGTGLSDVIARRAADDIAARGGHRRTAPQRPAGTDRLPPSPPPVTVARFVWRELETTVVPSMPWILVATHDVFRDQPGSCPECAGKPAATHGQCATCGAMLVAEDPRPGEFLTTTLIPVDPTTGSPLPSRGRRSIRIQDGWKRPGGRRSCKGLPSCRPRQQSLHRGGPARRCLDSLGR